jgi:hypothetical protein
MSSLPLNYPIMKTSLKKGYLLKKDLDEKNKQSFLQKYILQASNVIIKKIISKTPNSDEEASDPKNNQLIYYFNSTNPEKYETLLKELNEQKYTTSANLYYSTIEITDNELNEVKVMIMDALTGFFPDSKIVMDPLKTYLFIDWN